MCYIGVSEKNIEERQNGDKIYTIHFANLKAHTNFIIQLSSCLENSDEKCPYYIEVTEGNIENLKKRVNELKHRT